MAYLVLARKYRPQNFSELIGQEFVARTLQNSVRTERISHAFLFSGPRGVGKTSAARILAKAVNCLNIKTSNGEPCNSCPVCEEISSGRSLDVIEIDGASNRGIESIRELRETVKYTPANYKYKVYIIDEVHMLTKEAFNALLKTLEEPPSHIIFIFATTEPHNVPITILSRCQRYDFHRIPSNLIAKHLRSILEKENIPFEEEAILTISRHSEGSMRDAETLLDQIIALGEGSLKTEDVQKILGLVQMDSFLFFFNSLLENKKKDCIVFLKKLTEEGRDFTVFFAEFLNFLRGVMIFQNTEDDAKSILDCSEKEAEIYKSAAQRINQNTLLSMMDIISDTYKELKFSPHPSVTAELIALKLAEANKGINIRNLYKEVISLKKGVSSTTTQKTTLSSTEKSLKEEPKDNTPNVEDIINKYKTPSSSESLSEEKKKLQPVTVDENTLKKEWTSFIEELKDTKFNILKIPNSHKIESFNPSTDTIVICVYSKLLAELLNERDNMNLLCNSLSKRFGKKFFIKSYYKVPEQRPNIQPNNMLSNQKSEENNREELYNKAVRIFGGSFLDETNG